MPKEMLLEKVRELQTIAEELKAYAEELGAEEDDEGEEAPAGTAKDSQSGGGKMSMAMSAMRKKIGSY